MKTFEIGEVIIFEGRKFKIIPEVRFKECYACSCKSAVEFGCPEHTEMENILGETKYLKCNQEASILEEI